MAGIRHATSSSAVGLIGDAQWDEAHVVDEGSILVECLEPAVGAAILGSVAGGPITHLPPSAVIAMLEFVAGGGSAPITSVSTLTYIPSPTEGVDCRALFQTAMDAATSAGLPLFVYPGTYSVARNGSSAWALKPTGALTVIGVPSKSIIKLIPDAVVGPLLIFYTTNVSNLEFKNLVLDGNWGNYGTNAVTAYALPAATIAVKSTAGFPNSGYVWVMNTDGDTQKIAYTGKTSNSFTGCTGGSGNINIGARLGLYNSVYGINHATYSVYVGHVAPGSNGQSIESLVSNELFVDTMDANIPAGGWPTVTSGTLAILTDDRGWQKVAFTGKDTGNLKFTGVTASDSGTGVISTGNALYYAADPKSHGIAIGDNTQNVLIEGCIFQQIYGDGVRVSSGLLYPSAKNITIRRNQIDGVCARNGITLSMHAENILIENNVIDNVFTTAIDCEPELDGAWLRGLWVRNNTMGSLANRGTWFMDHGSAFENVFSIGGASSQHPQPNNWIQHVRVENNKMFGSVTICDGTDVILRGNTIYNINGTAWPAIHCTVYNNDIWIDANWVYDMSVAPASFTQGSGAINILRYVTHPLNVCITRNAIYARNGKAGIHLEGGAGPTGTTGTATSVVESIGTTPGYLEHTGASWTNDLYNGLSITMGGRNNAIVDTIDATDRLQFGQFSNWTDAFGNEVPAPPAGAYTIHTAGGVHVIEGNTIDCRNSDSSGPGGPGIRIASPQTANCRYRICRNSIRGATDAAVDITAPGTAPNAFKMLELTDNHFWDDQQVVTCTKGIKFNSTSNLGKWIMRGNVTEASITTPLSGVSSGQWLVNDGDMQEWEGYGVPAMSSNNGSRYFRRDGGASSTIYLREGGSWVAK